MRHLFLSIVAIIALSALFSAPTWAKSQPFYPWYIYPYNEVPTYLEEFNSYISQDECH